MFIHSWPDGWPCARPTATATATARWSGGGGAGNTLVGGLKFSKITHFHYIHQSVFFRIISLHQQMTHVRLLATGLAKSHYYSKSIVRDKIYTLVITFNWCMIITRMIYEISYFFWIRMVPQVCLWVRAFAEEPGGIQVFVDNRYSLKKWHFAWIMWCFMSHLIHPQITIKSLVLVLKIMTIAGLTGREAKVTPFSHSLSNTWTRRLLTRWFLTL